MKELVLRSLDGAPVCISGVEMERLAADFRGGLVLPGDGAYDSARRIHNGMMDRRPALIARCRDTLDVVKAVRFAAEHRILVSVRGGGHGVAGFAVPEGGLMIDLAPMKAIRVEAAARTACAEGGMTWGEFDAVTQEYGLATTGGSARPTGIAGLTLAGGHGLLMRKHGLACDNLLSAEVVTADGRVRTASPTENEDLFWALRGGGGNFGVVTSFTYQLHPVESVLGGLVIYPIQQAGQVLEAYQAFSTSAPDEVGSLAVLATLPDGTKAVVLLLAYNGSIDPGERVLRPLRSLGTPLADTVAATTYVALQSIVEQFNPPGMRNYWKTSYFQHLGSETIDLLLEHYAQVPSPLSHIVVYSLGGAVSRVPADATAVAYRDAGQVLLTVGMWDKPEEDERNRQWVRRVWAGAEPFAAGGFYVNYDADVAPDRVRAAYGPGKYDRLSALKARWDPLNLFRLNQNIRFNTWPRSQPDPPPAVVKTRTTRPRTARSIGTGASCVPSASRATSRP